MTIDYNTENCVISVGVSDFERSLDWYRDVLGFELVYRVDDYGWGEVSTPFGLNIGLGQTETVTPGNVTPTFGVRDIDAAIAHLREQGVTVEDWHEVPGMVRLSTFYDPDGTSFMLAQTLDRKDSR
jgi:catechol 2,3-dioxygenase-like lactoylglutathione lyase family enzyme